MPTNARYAVYQGKSKVKENVRDLTSSISQTKADRASGRKEQQEQRRKTIAKRRSEMEQVKQKKQPASSVHERPTTRQEQYHDEQTSKQSNIQTSYKEYWKFRCPVHLKIKWQQTEAVRRPSRIIQNHQSLKFSTSWFLTDFLNGGGFDWWSTSCIL